VFLGEGSKVKPAIISPLGSVPVGACLYPTPREYGVNYADGQQVKAGDRTQVFDDDGRRWVARSIYMMSTCSVPQKKDWGVTPGRGSTGLFPELD
jgi:hypothetical protein